MAAPSPAAAEYHALAERIPKPSMTNYTVEDENMTDLRGETPLDSLLFEPVGDKACLFNRSGLVTGALDGMTDTLDFGWGDPGTRLASKCKTSAPLHKML